MGVVTAWSGHRVFMLLVQIVGGACLQLHQVAAVLYYIGGCGHNTEWAWSLCKVRIHKYKRTLFFGKFFGKFIACFVILSRSLGNSFHHRGFQ